jgi:hypothetical protein
MTLENFKTRRVETKYPRSSAHWKKTRQVFHTRGVPPNFGRSIRPINGSRRKRRKAEKKTSAALKVGTRERMNGE